MVAWLIDSALRLRRLLLAAVVAVLGVGFGQLQNAKVDVYPEFGGTQVEVQAEALGLSAQEVEQLITVPIEQDLLNGVPWLTSITSRSMPGLSAIDLRFEPGTDLYRARQMVQERMSQAKALPNVGSPPAVIQPTSSTGRVAMIGMHSSSVSLIDMSVLARWTIRPRLMSIPGVAQVSIFGQQDRQLQVQVDPQRLQAGNVTLTQLIDTTGNALWVSPLSFVEASTPGTGGFVETPTQRLGVQHVQPITSPAQLSAVTLEGVQGPPVRLGDVASVVEDHQPLIGNAAVAGQPSLMLVVERFPDADLAQVTEDVDAALIAMRPGLHGITMDSSVYRPVRYLGSALHRLGIAALVGLLLMLPVIGVLGRSWRVAVVAVGSVATSVTAALGVFYLRGTTVTSMTLLGLAAAMVLVIDDAVGDTAALASRLRGLRDAGAPALGAGVADAVVRRRGPLMYATAITVLALGPLLLLTGPVGALVRPVVLTFTLVLLVSLLVAVVVTPVLAVTLLRGAPARRSGDGRGPRWELAGRSGPASGTGGRPVVGVVVLVVLALLAVPGVAALRGGSTLPAAQDRSLVVHLESAPGTSLQEMTRITTAAAAELRTVPGVHRADAEVGRAVASDRVTDVSTSDIWVTISDDADYARTLERVRGTVRGYPGLRSDVHTYAAGQLAAAGATSGDGLVVRVYGQDFATLRSTAEAVRQEIQTVGGVISPRVQRPVSEPAIEIQVDLTAAERAGLRPGDVRRNASTLISGLTVGSLYQDQAIFDVVLWTGPPSRSSLSSLQSLLLDTPSGTPVRLGDIAQVRLASSPPVITHDAVSRSLDVTAQIRGRSAAEVAQDVTTHLRRLTFPYEYRAEVVGDAVHRAETRHWIGLCVVAVGTLAYLLLQAATGSWRGGAVLLFVVPFALVGGLLAARFTGGMLTGGVLAALFAVTALALRQSLLLIRRAQALCAETAAPGEAMRRAVREQAGSVLGVTAAAAALFLPATVMGVGPGTELLAPFATTLLGGLLTSLGVVLLAIPRLYPDLARLRPLPVASPGADDDRHSDGDPPGEPPTLPGQRLREEAEREVRQ